MPSELMWDRWLRFRDPVLESAFRLKCQEWFSGVDLVVMANGLLRLAAQYVLLVLDRSDLGLGAHMQLLGLLLIMFLIFVRNCFQPGDGGRSAWVGLHRLMVTVGTTKAQTLFSSPGESIPGVVKQLVFESTSTQMAVLTIGLPLQFKEHVVAHSICLLICTFWTSPLSCRVWGDMSRAEGVFEELASRIDAGLMHIASFGMFSGTPGSYGGADRVGFAWASCWLVLGFAHAVVGYVIPTAVVYCGEMYVRSRFLRRRGIQNLAVSGLGLCSQAIAMICWSSLILLMSFWAVLRLWDDGEWWFVGLGKFFDGSYCGDTVLGDSLGE